MRTRIEIQKGDDWVELYLGEEKVIRYNVVINRVGSINNRNIKHSNTFEIPYVSQNIQALDINRFSPIEMARALNIKYRAKYYVREKLLQIGYVVVDNAESGVIKLNFIDEALNIIEKWGAVTYKDFLTSESSLIPSDFATNIALLRDYNLSHVAIVAPTPVVGSRGYKLALFPNNLNAVGDTFQMLNSGVRLITGFNPYQSRPIWNVKGFFDIVTEGFGYTPIYDPSVDWDRLEKTYLIENKLDSSSNSDEPYSVEVYGTIASNLGYGYDTSVAGATKHTNIVYPADKSTRIGSYSASEAPDEPTNITKTNYKNVENNILEIHTDNLDVGSITWEYTAKYTGTATPWTAWRSTSNPNLIIWKNHTVDITDNTSVGTGSTKNYTLIVDRANFIPPVGSSLANFIGVYLERQVPNVAISAYSTITNMRVTEKYLSLDTISYNAAQEIESESVDLTFSAPKLSIKDLITAVMRREGILMDFNNTDKEVRFFTYGSYQERRDEGNYSDWSDYFLYFSAPLFNTDYGNDYGKINEIGLASPFPGNTTRVTLASQGILSKYKDYVQNFSDKLKDVDSVISVPTTPAHYEYRNLGLGLVEDSGLTAGTLTQYLATGINQGTFTGLPYIWNVNGAIVPDGILQWYQIIDQAIRCTAPFLLPVDVIRTLKIHEPIYVERLGGFFIIEEVEEYIDGQTPVKVKLIKLLD